MDGQAKASKSRRRGLLFIAWVLLASTLPPIAVVVLTRHQALRDHEDSLQRTVDVAVGRANRLLQNADDALHRFVIDSKDAPEPDAVRRLVRLVYDDPRFREAGIIDAEGRLVATNFGPVQPPHPFPPHELADPTDPDLQVLGLFRTVVMEERSIVLALPMRGGGEVNVLVDPQVLTAYLQDLDLGPTGYLAFTMPDGAVLAATGDPSLDDDRLQMQPEDERLRQEGASNRGEIHVVADISRDWALHDWRRNLFVVVLVTLAADAVLAVLLYCHIRRPTGLDHDLRLGLKNREFSLRYQPIVELKTGHCVGTEVLMRWHHPDHGPVSPEVFIPIAEATGQIEHITRWVLRTAAQELEPLHRAYPEMWASVNVPLALFTDGQITTLVIAALKDAPVPMNCFRIEITERYVFEHDEGMISGTIADLNALGIRVGLDDFGVGGFGMSKLVGLNIEFLKLDKVFLREVGQDSRSTIVLDAMVEMSRRLGLVVIGEGIERPEHIQYLHEADVLYGQGWMIGKPIPVHELQQFLAHRPATALS